jgi:hypothetical protein
VALADGAASTSSARASARRTLRMTHLHPVK